MDIYKYRLKCITEDTNVECWRESPPTVCPNNNTHTIDSGSIVIINKRLNNEVIISEEKTLKTGGYFQAQSVSIDIPASSGWHEETFSFPIPISLLSASYVANSDIAGDEGEFLIGHDTITGVITSDIAVDDNVLDVSQTVIDNTFVGCWIKVNTEDFGRVLFVDEDNLKITVENAATGIHTAADYVKQTVKMSPHLRFPNTGVIVIGESAIGGSYIPADVQIKIRYNNISGTAKTFSAIIEYLY